MNSICNICNKHLPAIVQCSKKLSKSNKIIIKQNISHVNNNKIVKQNKYNKFQKTNLSLIDRKIQDMII